jgi:RNA polymerase sigma factor (sigma-70 family)
MRGGITGAEAAKLIARIRRGDREAEGEFAALFYPRVLVMLLARTHDVEAARDLTQELMLVLVREFREGRPEKPESLAAYVYGTARNLANDHIRRCRRQGREVPVSSDAVHPDPPAFDRMATAEDSALVRQLLSRLHPRDRRILEMFFVDALTPTQIAERLSLSPEVVRKRKSRALRKMLAWLQRKRSR